MESREIVQTFIDASWRSMPRDAGRTVMGNQAARLCRQPASCHLLQSSERNSAGTSISLQVQVISNSCPKRAATTNG